MNRGDYKYEYEAVYVKNQKDRTIVQKEGKINRKNLKMEHESFRSF